MSFIFHFPFRSQLEHRAPFGVSVITRTIRHAVGLLWMSDQPVAETSTFTGQHKRQTSMPQAGFDRATTGIGRRDALTHVKAVPLLPCR
jgi:hypothetical protein